MSSWKMVVVAAALSGCAGLQKAPEADLASGHWEGEIDNNGWRRPVSFDLERTGGSWRGQWQLVSEVPGQSLQNVEVSGRDVRFEAGTLRVAGHVDRGTLRGTVTDKAADEAKTGVPYSDSHAQKRRAGGSASRPQERNSRNKNWVPRRDSENIFCG